MDRYWVGGTGNWSDTAHWSTSTGGSGGASAPISSSTNVHFDNLSFTDVGQIVTCNFVSPRPICNNFDWTGALYTPTFRLGADFDIHGNITLIPNMIWQYNPTASMDIYGSGTTWNTAGITIQAYMIRVNLGKSGSITLASDLTFNGYFIHSNTTSTFDTGGYDMTIVDGNNYYGSTIDPYCWLSGGVNNLNDSTITVQTWFRGGGTMNAGTSEIRMVNGNSSTYSNYTTLFEGGGKTYNNVVFDFTDVYPEDHVGMVSGDNTYNNFTIEDPVGTKRNVVVFNGTHTISGTFSCNGQSMVNRIFLTSYYTNLTPATISAANISLSYTDLYNINCVGAASPFIGTNLGNGGFCTGLTTVASMNKYWVGNTGNWSDTAHWSNESGSTGGADLPLPQDNVIFDDRSFTLDSQTITVDIPRMGRDISFTATTHSPSLVFSFIDYGDMLNNKAELYNEYSVFGDWTINSHWTVNGNYQNLAMRGNQVETNTITSGGCEMFNLGILFFVYSTSYQLMDDLNCASLFFTWGTFDANDKDITSYNIKTLRNMDTTIGGNPTIYFGNGRWDISPALSLEYDDFDDSLISVPDLEGSQTFFENSRVIVHDQHPILDINNDSWGVWTGYGLSWNILEINSKIRVVFDGTDTNTYNTFQVDAGSEVEFYAGSEYGTIINNSFIALGSPGAGMIKLHSDSEGDQFYLSKGGSQVCCDYLQLTDSNVTGGAVWHAGVNSTNVSNNTGWLWTSCAVTVVGDEILVSYKDGATYGIKRLDDTIKGTGIYYSLDLVAPKEFVKPLLWKSVVLRTKDMPAGTSIGLWYKINKDGEWVAAFMQDGVQYHTSGQEAVFLIGAEGMIFEFKLQLNPHDNDTPEIFLPVYVYFE